MILIDTAEAFERALSDIDAGSLRSLLALRYAQLDQTEGYAFEEIARFLIIQPGDTLLAIHGALDFDLDENFIDGARYGDASFCPSWEWLIDHGDVFEMTFVLSDDGFGWGIFIPNEAGIDSHLLHFCRMHADLAGGK